jgi:hypothetical protein
MSSARTAGTPKFSSVSMRTNNPPESTDGMTIGKVIVRNVRAGEEPRLCAASSTEMSMALRAATVGNST